MHHRSLLTILLTFLIPGFVVTSVEAQSTNRFEVEVPFQFIVGGRILPAGNYAVERLDPGKPNILRLKNLDNGMMRAILCQRVEKEKPSTTSFLLFTQREGGFFLSQVWDQGSLNGNQLPENLKDNRRKANDTKQFVVKARDNASRQ